MMWRSQLICGLLVAAAMFAIAALWEFSVESLIFKGSNLSESVAEKWTQVLFVTLLAGTASWAAAIWSGRAGRERARLTKELEEKARLLRITLEAMDQGICVFDKDLRLAAWNERYIEINGHPRELVKRGTPVHDLIRAHAQRGTYGGDDVEKIAAERVTYYFGRGVATREERTRADGRVIDIRRNPTPDGGYISSYTDITDLKEAQEAALFARDEAEQASRTKTDFLAQMSHELRTPLNAIIGFSEVIACDTGRRLDEAKIREFAGHVRTAGQHLLSLINDVLDVSAIEAGRVKLEEAAAQPADIIRDAVGMLSAGASQRRIELVTLLEDGGASLHCDGRRISQALLNVLGNAMKFTPDGGRIVVRCHKTSEGGIAIAVTDTGVGIAPGDLDRIVKPFEQAVAAGLDNQRGVGLGLAIVKAIMDLHGGSLVIESQPGRGTTVTLRFPPGRATGHREAKAG